MKKFIFFLLIVSFNALAQKSNPLTFSEVIEAPGVSKDELYNRARMWFTDTYKNPQKVLQIQDKESGEIVGKGNVAYYSRYFSGSEGTKGVINYTVKIFVKEGRFKYEISDFIHEAYKTNDYPSSYGLITESNEYEGNVKVFKGFGQKVWMELKDNCKLEKNLLIESLIKSMESQSKSSDW